METKEMAVIGAGILGAVGVAYGIKSFFQKRAISKTISDETVQQRAKEALQMTLKADLQKKAAARQQISALQASFEDVFNRVEAVPFDRSWSNGTGYLDGAVGFNLPAGKVVKTTDGSARRVIMVGTEYGTIVMFERYTYGNGPFVVVSNTPLELKEEIPSGSMPFETFEKVLATYAK